MVKESFLLQAADAPHPQGQKEMRKRELEKLLYQAVADALGIDLAAQKTEKSGRATEMKPAAPLGHHDRQAA